MGRPGLWVRLQPNGMTEGIGEPLEGGRGAPWRSGKALKPGKQTTTDSVIVHDHQHPQSRPVQPFQPSGPRRLVAGARRKRL